MKAGDKVKVKKWKSGTNGMTFFKEFLEREYTFIGFSTSGNAQVVSESGLTWYFPEEAVYLVNEPKDDHYNNDNGSLYLFAQQHDLNAYEFEVIKRIVRCRKKGEFISDIEKTKRVLDLYLKEQGHNYKDQVEQLNK
jgi:hypothetical protein